MNKKWIILMLSGILSAFGANAQKLTFRKDSTFKIVQFTDLHYLHGNPASDTTLILIPRILDEEKPDLVIFTGDIVLSRPVREGWNVLAQILIDREIPFAVTLGNHCHEQDMTREDIADIVTAYPFNVNSLSDVSPDRVMDNVIPVHCSKHPQQKEAALIYTFDTGGDSGRGGYDWITPKQIEWYREQSLHYAVRNNNKPLPAVAYFHIPLPEYGMAFDDEKNIRYGVRNEHGGMPRFNSGMFCSMKEMGDVMGTFVGHDHVNDYIVNYHGIALAYGHFSGWKTTYNPGVTGARVVVLKEGKREFDTWLRRFDGTLLHKISYPGQLTAP